MRMILLGGLLLNLPAQAPSAPPCHVPVPPGWKKETIPLPPSFAPDMKWTGTEEVRFPPGMFKVDSPNFFSYGMLFWLPDDVAVDAQSLERALLCYYRGLAKAVSTGKKRPIDPASFTLTLAPAKTQPDKRPSGERVAGYMGELHWTEPFVTGKPQTLHIEIHTWPSAKHQHTCVFVCASPQPDRAAIWQALREVRAGCTVR